MKINNLKFKIYNFILVSALVFLAASCNRQTTIDHVATVTIGDHMLNVEIADTQDEQLLGLSFRESLAEDAGMLFLLKDKHRYTFWMKDMKFPLDIIWILDGKVFEINPNAQPEPGVKDSNLKIYIPSKPVDTVLEVNAGWAEKNGIKIGDRVIYNR